MYGTARPLYTVCRTALVSAAVADNSLPVVSFHYLKPRLFTTKVSTNGTDWPVRPFGHVEGRHGWNDAAMICTH